MEDMAIPMIFFLLIALMVGFSVLIALDKADIANFLSLGAFATSFFTLIALLFLDDIRGPRIVHNFGNLHDDDDDDDNGGGGAATFRALDLVNQFSKGSSKNLDCGCMINKPDILVLPCCGKTMHGGCIRKWMSIVKDLGCPDCGRRTPELLRLVNQPPRAERLRDESGDVDRDKLPPPLP